MKENYKLGSKESNVSGAGVQRQALVLEVRTCKKQIIKWFQGYTGLLVSCDLCDHVRENITDRTQCALSHE